ncbi:phosphotransferase family protein [Promicromonospora iranensis]|nr:aminoglycoside phosphotransferase family protein [Promicromonospora iranensis]
MKDFTEESLRDQLELACSARGMSAAGARLVHHYSNAVFVLPALDAVVRINVGQTAPAIGITQEVTRWLVNEHAYPATAPVEDAPPVQLDSGLTASFWRYYPQPDDGPPFRSAHLADLLRRLHDLPMPPIELPRWEPFGALRRVLSQNVPLPGLSDEEVEWLRDRVDAVQHQIAAAHWPLGHGMVHGDGWAGNLLWDRDRVMLGDWDNVSLGPREIDLIPTWHAAIRYGRETAWVQEFADTYGYDMARHESFDLLLQMRDLVQLSGPLRRAGESEPHLAALRQRFEGIRTGNRSQSWIGL